MDRHRGVEKTDSITKVVFSDDFSKARPTSTHQWFCNMLSLSKIQGLGNLNLSEVTDMSYMFYNCISLTELNWVHFNAAKATDMSGMFYHCINLKTLNLTGFSTPSAINMSAMFCGCSSLTSLNLSGFNTENVTDMSQMFSGCLNLKSLNLSSFNTKNVTDMSGMFSNCWFLTDVDLSGFNTDNVTDMSGMFRRCHGFTSTNVSKWLSKWNTAKVTNMYEMFYECTRLTDFDVNLNTANVTNMSNMFWDCWNLKNIDVSHLKTSNVTNISGMFMGCSALSSLDISNFNTANVTDMSRMFQGCKSLTSLDVSNLNTANVTDMSGMFNGCTGVTYLDVSHFNTSKVTDMGKMFKECSALTFIDISGFNTSNIKYADDMFYNCTGLKELSIGNNDFKKVESYKDNDVHYSPTRQFWDIGTSAQPCLLVVGSEFDLSIMEKRNDNFYYWKYGIFKPIPVPQEITWTINPRTSNYELALDDSLIITAVSTDKLNITYKITNGSENVKSYVKNGNLIIKGLKAGDVEIEAVASGGMSFSETRSTITITIIRKAQTVSWDGMRLNLVGIGKEAEIHTKVSSGLDIDEYEIVEGSENAEIVRSGGKYMVRGKEQGFIRIIARQKGNETYQPVESKCGFYVCDNWVSWVYKRSSLSIGETYN